MMFSTVTDLHLLIVADDPLVRTGLTTLLADLPGCTISGQVSSEVDLMAALDVYCPDVVVWDLGWNPQPALERLAEWGDIDPPVMVLLPDETHAAAARFAGARGLLSREADGRDMLVALQAVAGGFLVLDPILADALGAPEDVPAAFPIDKLTPRELEVVQLLAQGLANKAIAHRLGISEHTVKFHVNAIMDKLDAQNRTEAAVRATRMGLIFL